MGEKTRATTHACPGGCGRNVANDLFACRSCWFALPQDIRQRIWHGWRNRDEQEHREGMVEAVEWYANRPPCGSEEATDG